MIKDIINSREKHESHGIINSILFPWIEFNQGKDGLILTMPANSGRHELMILDHLQRYNSKLRLHTFDKDFHKHEVGIPSSCDWSHHRGDIFRSLNKLNPKPQPTAAWFDFCGGLTESNREGMQESVEKFFAHGSLLFVTLAVNAIRSLGKNSMTRSTYESASTVRGKVVLTDQLLKDMVARTKTKYIKPVIKPFVYQRVATTFVVYGYIVGETLHY